ncbi:MAG TPA: hypothetical protein EYG51_00340 [Pseudomonadales bacterium]|nr:hypothetical protein [Pseudomonadales bacterium]
MRELTVSEVEFVSGGFSNGTKVPFMNKFIAGANWPGGAPGALAGISIAWKIGTTIGNAVNSFNQQVSGMSFGVAIYRTMNPTRIK